MSIEFIGSNLDDGDFCTFVDLLTKAHKNAYEETGDLARLNCLAGDLEDLDEGGRTQILLEAKKEIYEYLTDHFESEELAEELKNERVGEQAQEEIRKFPDIRDLKYSYRHLRRLVIDLITDLGEDIDANGGDYDQHWSDLKIEQMQELAKLVDVDYANYLFRSALCSPLVSDEDKKRWDE